MLTMGDSALIGYNGTRTMDRFSVPKQVALSLGKLTGAPVEPGLLTFPAATSTLADRYSTTGTVFWSYPFAMLGAGATLTYETEQPGTELWIYYVDNTAGFSYSIDGAAAVNVPAPAGAGVGAKLAVTGLSNTTHRVVITAAANYVYIAAIQVSQQYAIASHNMAYGGSRAAVDVNNSWTAGTAGTSLKIAREVVRLTSGFPDPDLILIGLGGNDMLQGDAAATAINGIRTMRNWFPNADCILTGGVFSNSANAANVAAYSEAKYALAEELDAVYFDYRDLWKDADYALAQGAVGADNFHPIDGFGSEMGRQIAEIISGSGAVAGVEQPKTIVLKTVAAPVISSAMDGNFIRCDSASAQALTVPANSTDPIPIGASFEGQQYGAGLVTITAAGGVTLRSSAGLKVNGQYGVFGLRKIAINEWAVYGDLTT